MQINRLLIVVLLLVNNIAKAEWSYKGASPEGDITLYVDKSTKKINYNDATMWVLMDYKDEQKQTDPLPKKTFAFKSVLALIHCNCTEEKFTFKSMHYYTKNMAQGENLFTVSNQPSIGWQYPPPGTIAKTLYNFACGIESP